MVGIRLGYTSIEDMGFQRRLMINKKIKSVETIEQPFDRRRLIFLVRNTQLLAAYVQTSGGWGEVDASYSMSSKLFSQEELQKNQMKRHYQ